MPLLLKVNHGASHREWLEHRHSARVIAITAGYETHLGSWQCSKHARHGHGLGTKGNLIKIRVRRENKGWRDSELQQAVSVSREFSCCQEREMRHTVKRRPVNDRHFQTKLPFLLCCPVPPSTTQPGLTAIPAPFPPLFTAVKLKFP